MPDPESTSAQPLAAPVSFDRVASEYEATRYLPERVADEVAAFVTAGVPPDEWVLDAGIGTGRIGRALARAHPRTVGVDVSSGMMRRMSAPCRPYLALADLRALPFAENTFARILTVHVLHLIADWPIALAELWRTLAPNGLLVLGVEDREPTVVREYYLKRAEEKGLLPPRRGAHSLEVKTLLEEWGVGVSSHRPPTMTWEMAVPVREVLDGLARRTYSILWNVPEKGHRTLVAETERFALDRFGSLEYAERVAVQVQLYVAAKPAA